ncbi:type II toxin-antitoxin system VapC family toxin [Pseudarthrobacter raffinosi]|uniref:type II toxin-antitoxin system VapC family toxin n=1 Tax=Pseudarthrobacter raffinosi TaxID=2953651 RepID=UPI00208E6B06|nr:MULTISPECIES: type II toxin-antitoxin system VapC family toxin [unclassified Pseudarthrobacter]MCO4236830.1 type II toxin-antitoxin system VapC family toxin [Pseudarthrobacter sp. MDT3-28]MCO4250221.1 type II toxin-antitoxin system VapC family toxin [Pseudarthrobacter sp. MDT3-9]MCO4263587.1 type II toxin-antitoxin system VapC family toxin [Pseudarthrobacter sp. MDT3-26]
MRLLLDTHVFLWALAEPRKLSTKARNAITKLENSVYVSPMTAYELSYKHHQGKLPAGAAIVASFGRQVAHLYASELSISAPHALAAGQLDWEHKDPFDRILAAQAMVEGLTLVTADEELHAFEPVTTLW